ncbi:hypothetical protein DENSPDRAFT_527560 [Dentipellis sp. KUC8613]|nr:hypothetical protein DENSPDRAFT_527560 [Dentipellis sp. KUC8613]
MGNHYNERAFEFTYPRAADTHYQPPHRGTRRKIYPTLTHLRTALETTQFALVLALILLISTFIFFAPVALALQLLHPVVHFASRILDFVAPLSFRALVLAARFSLYLVDSLFFVAAMLNFCP